MDDLTKQVLNDIPEPVTEEVESPTTETNDVEVQQEETPASESESEETTEQPTKEVDQLPKKGAESRIRELNSQVKKERAEKESLAQKIQELTGSVEPQGYQPQNSGYNPNVPLIAPGEEVTQEELQRRVAQRDQWLLQQANNMTRFEMAKKETLDRVNRESDESIKAYPQLDPDSDSFDDELSESISQATLAYVRTNPTGSVKKFVDGLMKPYMRSLDKSVASQQTEIAKQASQTAMRPNSVPSTDKKVEDMSTEELEKKLGVVY